MSGKSRSNNPGEFRSEAQQLQSKSHLTFLPDRQNNVNRNSCRRYFKWPSTYIGACRFTTVNYKPLSDLWCGRYSRSSSS